MENNINKENQENKSDNKSRKKYTPKKKGKTPTQAELNERLNLILKEEAEKIQPTDNQLHYSVISTDEEKEKLKNKYLKTPLDDFDKLLKNIETLTDTDITSESIIKSEDSIDDMSEDDIEDIAKKINEQISKLNQKFYSLIKQEEETPIIEEVKIKISKPKFIKIPKETYKQIKSHCKEHNVDVEDWIEKITLNEINRIIIRLGDLDYKNLKERKKEKKKKKDKSIN